MILKKLFLSKSIFIIIEVNMCWNTYVIYYNTYINVYKYIFFTDYKAIINLVFYVRVFRSICITVSETFI